MKRKFYMKVFLVIILLLTSIGCSSNSKNYTNENLQCEIEGFNIDNVNNMEIYVDNKSISYNSSYSNFKNLMTQIKAVLVENEEYLSTFDNLIEFNSNFINSINSDSSNSIRISFKESTIIKLNSLNLYCNNLIIDVDNSSIYYWDDNKSDENSILVYKVGCIKGNFNNLSEHIMAIIK